MDGQTLLLVDFFRIKCSSLASFNVEKKSEWVFIEILSLEMIGC